MIVPKNSGPISQRSLLAGAEGRVDGAGRVGGVDGFDEAGVKSAEDRQVKQHAPDL